VASPGPFQFGVSEFTTQPWSFEQDVETYKQFGVDAIEVCEVKLDEEQERAAEQLALVGQSGLPITSVQPKTRTLFPSRSQPEPKEPREPASGGGGAAAPPHGVPAPSEAIVEGPTTA